MKVVTQPALTVRAPLVYRGGRASMPAPLRQCRTTCSPGRTRVTPGPVSSTTTDLTPTFQWNAATDASGIKHYQVQVADYDLTGGDIDITTTATSYTPTVDIPPDTVYWRVRAVDNVNNVGVFGLSVHLRRDLGQETVFF